MNVRIAAGMLLPLTLSLWGCGPGKPVGETRVKTTPVTGIIQVDGEPTPGVVVTFNVQGEIANFPRKLVSTGSGEGGKFTATTYEQNDGLPAGAYILTFTKPTPAYGKGDLDQLNRAYDDPGTSEVTVTVTEGTPVDMGVIELSSKKKPPPKGAARRGPKKDKGN